MSKKRVLLVDDEVGFTAIVKINLEATGDYDVRVQNETAGVVATAKEFQPDIILLDIVMPGMDGGDVKRKIQATPELAKIPIIFVTALVSADDAGEDAVIQSGGDIMLAKPIKIGKLVQCIEDCVAGRL